MWSPIIELGQMLLNFTKQIGCGAVSIVWSFPHKNTVVLITSKVKKHRLNVTK